MNWWVRCKIGIWFVLCFSLVGSQGIDPIEKRFFQVFDELGIEPSQFVLQHIGRMTGDINQSEVDQYVKKLGKSLHFTHIQKEVTFDGIRYHAVGEFRHNLKIRFHVINDELRKTRVRPYFSIQLNGDGKMGSNWIQAKADLQQILTNFGIVPSFFYSIQGSKESVSSSDPKGLLIQALTKLNANEVEAMEAKQTTSISAFSPLIPNQIKTKGGWMNVQMATRMNLQTKKVTITLGTPIIMIEY